ncbi:MAG: hypothetical protein ACRD96_17275 [Bryobacteraceae bacterium]
MRKCLACGGRLQRIPRAFRERFLYSAVFKCRDCAENTTDERWYMMPFGKFSRCPHCGTHRVVKMRGVDRIDRMYRHPISYWQRHFGAPLLCCPFCRLQFYDRRPRLPAAKPAASEPVAEPAED